MKIPRLGGAAEEKIQLDEIHIWRVSLAEAATYAKGLLHWLSDDELAKSQRFHFEKDRYLYIAARGALRQILSGYLGQEPEQLRFEYNAYGKPRALQNPGCNHIEFSLSHSGDTALYSVAGHRSTGVDVERINNRIDTELIARRFFSEAETKVIESATETRRKALFFQIWSRKEAVLKAMGTGISFPMEQLDVSHIKENAFSPVFPAGNRENGAHWYVQDLPAGNGYAAAVAVAGGSCNLVLRGDW